MSRAAERRKTATLKELIAHSLAQAMSVPQMEKLARRVIPGYDLHRSSGFPESIPIPQMDAAAQITEDLDRDGLLPRFSEELIRVHHHGVMGRKLSIRLLPRILAELKTLGWTYSEELGVFMEDGPKTKGWGILREGAHYDLAFLRLDVVRSTDLVRRAAADQVSRVYADLQALARGIVEKRDGRLWSWEGDGALAAFYFRNKNVTATLCGIELLVEVFLYNRLRSPLDGPLSIRLAVHTGQSPFLQQTEQISSEVLRQLERLEAEHTEPDSLTISSAVYNDLGSRLAGLFRAVPAGERRIAYSYRLRWR